MGIFRCADTTQCGFGLSSVYAKTFFSFQVTVPIEIFKAVAGSLECLQRRVSSFGSLPAGNES